MQPKESVTPGEVGTILSLRAAKRCVLCKGLISGTSHISDSVLSYRCVPSPSSSQPQVGNKTQITTLGKSSHGLGTWSADIHVLGADVDRARQDASHSLDEVKHKQC